MWQYSVAMSLLSLGNLGVAWLSYGGCMMSRPRQQNQIRGCSFSANQLLDSNDIGGMSGDTLS